VGVATARDAPRLPGDAQDHQRDGEADERVNDIQADAASALGQRWDKLPLNGGAAIR
jgi:hypothetical protein